MEKGLNLPFLESSNPCTVIRRLERFVEVDGGLRIPTYLRFSHQSSGGNSRKRRPTSSLPEYMQTRAVLGRVSALRNVYQKYAKCWVFSLGRVIAQARSISAANPVPALRFRARLAVSSTFRGCAEGEMSPKTAHARLYLYYHSNPR